MNKVHYQTKPNSSLFIPETVLPELNGLLLKLGAEKYLEGNILNIPNGIIGYLETDALKIEIQPSISSFTCQDYLRLISPTESLSYSSTGYLGMDDSESMSEYIVSEFYLALQAEIKEGLPRRYSVKEKLSDYAVGNTDFVRSYERAMCYKTPTFLTTEAELSHNYFILQVIKAAYNKICKHSGKYTDYLIISALSGVTVPLQIKELLEQPVHFARNEQGLGYIYELAKIIINNMDSMSKDDDYEMSILVNANKIFEDFVFSLLVSLFPRERFESSVENNITTGNKQLLSYADIVFYGQRTVVIDAKNKNYSGSPSNADYYQMFSYLHTYEASTAVLVYPHYQDELCRQVVPITDNKLKIYMLPVNIKPEGQALTREHFHFFESEVDKILRFG